MVDWCMVDVWWMLVDVWFIWLIHLDKGCGLNMPKHDAWYMLMQVWTNYQLGPGSIERVIRTYFVRKLLCWRSSNGQDSDMPIWILPRLIEVPPVSEERTRTRCWRSHPVMSWDVLRWRSDTFQIFHGMVCNALSILEKMSKLLGVVPFKVLADQSKWVISKSHTLVSSIFLFPCHFLPGSCVSCSRTWSSGSTSVASGAPRVAGSRRPVVADGWRHLLGGRKIGVWLWCTCVDLGKIWEDDVFCWLLGWTVRFGFWFLEVEEILQGFSWGSVIIRRGHTQAASGEAKFQWFFRGLVQHRKMRVPPKPRGLRSRRWGQAQLTAARGHPKVPEWLVSIHLTSLSGDCRGSAIIHEVY